MHHVILWVGVNCHAQIINIFVASRLDGKYINKMFRSTLSWPIETEKKTNIIIRGSGSRWQGLNIHSVSLTYWYVFGFKIRNGYVWAIDLLQAEPAVIMENANCVGIICCLHNRGGYSKSVGYFTISRTFGTIKIPIRAELPAIGTSWQWLPED